MIRKSLLYSLLGLFVFPGIYAQERLLADSLLRERKTRIESIPVSRMKAEAVEWAREKSLPVRQTRPGGGVIEIRRLGPNGGPKYLVTDNIDAAKTLSTDQIWGKSGNPGYALTGNGILVGIWDGGSVRSSHREFQNRATLMNSQSSVIGHATHVAGTIGAAGILTEATGMAYESSLESYDWNSDIEEMESAASYGLLLSNHSYGYIIGFDYNYDKNRWEWYGDPEVSEDEDYYFGFYHEEAREYDRVAHNNPSYLIVKSAGNDRGEGPSTGTPFYIWSNGGWVLSNRERPKDGGEDGFDSMGPVATAKNILTVGAVNDLPEGFTHPDDVEITSYSAYGPTDDGRIKPDVVGNGEGLYSSYSRNDNDYAVSSGTSMSAPNVTGSLALLQEHFHDFHNRYMTAASLKGLVLHTADDAGNPGPDYSYGWGLMNTLHAAELISNPDTSLIRALQLDEGEEIRIRLFSDGSSPIKATICWTDPPGVVPDVAVDPADRILVNDLDLRILKEGSVVEFMPFVPDPFHPGSVAGTGDNVLDNVEQVLIESPQAGYYEVLIQHKGSLLHESQSVSLIVTGLTEQFHASGTELLTGNNGSFILTSSGEYLPGTEAGWLIAPENQMPVTLGFDYFSTEADRDMLKVYDGSDTLASLLAVFSGDFSVPDTLIQGTADTMLVIFSSDAQNQERGFAASYCTTAPEGTFVIHGESYPCSGSLESYEIMGQKGTFYNWLPPEGWGMTPSGTALVFLETGTTPGILEVVPWNHCGTIEPVLFQIQPLFSPPQLTTISGDSLICARDSAVLQVDSLPGTHYQWQLPDQWLGGSISEKISYIPSSEGGLVRVSARNACGSGDTLSLLVRVEDIPDEAPIYAEMDYWCQNAIETLYTDLSEGITFQWEVNNDWSIQGDDRSDSVSILAGGRDGTILLTASNRCGFRISELYISPIPEPEAPVLKEFTSGIKPFSELVVQNASAYESIQWCFNGLPINSPHALEPSYLANVSGLYSVNVSSIFKQATCVLEQNPQDGILLGEGEQVYAIYGWTDGSMIVHNNSADSAILMVSDTSGKILINMKIEPGVKVIQTSLNGVFIATLSGSGSSFASGIFLY